MSNDTAFECPNCGRKGLVRLHTDSDIFECLYCNWQEDLRKAGKQEGGFSWLLACFLAIVVALALVAG